MNLSLSIFAKLNIFVLFFVKLRLLPYTPVPIVSLLDRCHAYLRLVSPYARVLVEVAAGQLTGFFNFSIYFIFLDSPSFFI